MKAELIGNLRLSDLTYKMAKSWKLIYFIPFKWRSSQQNLLKISLLVLVSILQNFWVEALPIYIIRLIMRYFNNHYKTDENIMTKFEWPNLLINKIKWWKVGWSSKTFLLDTECRISNLAVFSINILLAIEMCCRYGPVRLCLFFSLFGTSHQSRHPVSIFLVKSYTITEQKKRWDEFLLPIEQSR